jgi:hypothetical protein
VAGQSVCPVGVRGLPASCVDGLWLFVGAVRSPSTSSQSSLACLPASEYAFSPLLADSLELFPL